MPYTALLKKFPYTTIASNLPDELHVKLDKIINYRFGILPESNMMTTDVLSYVKPNTMYRFTPGQLTLSDNQTKPCTRQIDTKIPQFIEIEGEWSNDHSHAREEANVLGGFGSFYTAMQTLPFHVEEATEETLSYYGATLVHSGDDVWIEAPEVLPVNVVRFDKNYEAGYLKLPEYGGGYYLEVHDTPHFWSHVSPEGSGVLLLGKKIKPNLYHLSAFTIAFGQAVYIPGGVIHCDGLLIGDIMAIYTITPRYSTVIIKDKAHDIPHVELIHAT
jgi:hypothetical protein